MAPPKKPTVAPRRPGERAAERPAPPPLTPQQLAFIAAPAGHPPSTREAPAGHPTGTQDEDSDYLGPMRGGHPTGTRGAPTGHPTGTRQAPGAAALIERKSGTKRRLNTYLRPETFEALAAYCKREEEDMARVVDRAVAEYLRAKGGPT